MDIVNEQMHIEFLETGELIPYDKNPKNNERTIQPLAKLIQEVGFRVPIIIDRDNIIVAGHARLKAAKLLNLKKLPIIYADDLSGKQIKAFRLADNKIGELSVWDEDLLAVELSELENQEIDMSNFGFEEEEVASLISSMEIPNFEPGSIGEQGDLTSLNPKYIVCPHCGEEFDVNG